MAVAVDAAALMSVQRGAVGLGDALVGGERGSLAGQRALDGLVGGDRPAVVEVQVREIPRHQRRVRQAGAVVFGGMLGNRQRRRHGFTDGVRACCRGARRALALANVKSDAEALVAIELDGLDFTLAHRGGQPLLHRHRHFAGAGALPGSLGDDPLDLLAQFGKDLRAHCRVVFAHCMPLLFMFRPRHQAAATGAGRTSGP